MVFEVYTSSTPLRFSDIPSSYAASQYSSSRVGNESVDSVLRARMTSMAPSTWTVSASDPFVRYPRPRSYRFIETCGA